ARLLVQVGVDGDEVRLAQQRVEVHLPCPQFALGGGVPVHVVVEDVHVPAAAAAPGQGKADAAHADDPEGAAGQVLAEVPQRLPGLPPAGEGIRVPLDDAAGGGDEQAEGHVGGGVGEHAGGVAHGDAALGGRRHVDVVEADGEVADH